MKQTYRILRGFFLLILFLSLPSCRLRQNQVAPASTPTILPENGWINILYSSTPSKTPFALNLDIYPAGAPKSPVLIYVHSGGWMVGDKSNVGDLPAIFQEHGFLFVSINFRLIPEVSLSDEIGDIAQAIAWVKDNITTYGGDPERLFLMGHSSGAHLVSLVSTDKTYLEKFGVSIGDIHGVISMDTQAYDIPAFMAEEQKIGNQSPVYIQVFGADTSTWMRFSPIQYIVSDEGIPPFLLVYSGSDTHPNLVENFATTLKKSNIAVQIIPATDKNHWELISKFGKDTDTLAVLIFDWLGNLP